MKFTKKLFALMAVAGLALAALPARAQNFDTFAQPRSIVLTPPRILDATAAVFTNGPIDISGFQGTANIDITSVTNAGGALTASFYTSSDQVTLVGLTNFAAITASTSYIYTNGVIRATNAWLLPGTITGPAAATSGFVTPYLDPTTVPFTNNTTLTITTKGVYRIGFRTQEQKRYLYVVYTPTGSSSNDIVSATFTGQRITEPGTSQ